MPSISHNFKAAFIIGYIYVMLLIPNVKSDTGSTADVFMKYEPVADSPTFQKVFDKLSSAQVEDQDVSPEKDPSTENNSSTGNDPLTKNDPSIRNDPSTGNDPSTQNFKNFEQNSNDPFVQKITRVSDDEDDQIEMSEFNRKKKFLWFHYGPDESGAARFHTLHGKDYNPYDFDENDNLNANQYDDKLISKIGTKGKGAKVEGAKVEGAKVEGAKVEGAKVEGAKVEGAIVEGAKVKGAKVEEAKNNPESKQEASSLKVKESLTHQPSSDRKEDMQEVSSTANLKMPDELSKFDDRSTKMEDPASETLLRKSTDKNDEEISDTQNTQMTESQLSQSSMKLKHQTEVKEEEPWYSRKAKKKFRERKIEDSLMLEFAHNRPDSRILWLNYPHYRSSDKYRLIDEAAERTFITYRQYGFVNTDTMDVAGRLITYIENNKKGYEILNLEITSEWNQKSLKKRAETCEYLVNDNMMLRQYQFIYDHSQPELIRAHDVIIILQMEDIQPRRLGALSCPVIQPNTSLAVTLFMSPIIYVNENTDEYVFTFVEDDPINYPLHVRLMFLSRLASGDSVEDEFVDDQRINAMNEMWSYGRTMGVNPEPTPNKLTSKNEKSTSKNDKLTSKNDIVPKNDKPALKK